MECRLPAACPALLLRASLSRFRHGAEWLTRLGPAGNPEEGLELGGQHDVACQSNPAAEVCVHGVRVPVASLTNSAASSVIVSWGSLLPSPRRARHRPSTI